MLGYEDLKAAFDDLNLQEELIIAHASLKPFGYIHGGAEAVLDAMLALLSKNSLNQNISATQSAAEILVNGGVVQTNTTDANGSLAIKSLLETPAQILEVRSVGLWDSSSNVVLSTTLP